MNKLLKSVAAVALLAGAGMPAGAQDEPDDYLLTLNAIEVPPGHQRAFREGVAAVVECYRQNGTEASWSVWDRLQGRGDVHLAVFPSADWSAMGETDPAASACRSVIEERIDPHVGTANVSVARKVPEYSGIDAEDFTVVRLHYFRVDDAGAFREAVGELSAIITKDEHHADDSWFEVIGGGPYAADFFVVEHFADYAALDAERPTAYEVVERAVGAEQAQALWARFDEALKDDREYWSYQFSLLEDLTLEQDED